MALLRLLLARTQQVPGRTLLTATDDLVDDLVADEACNARNSQMFLEARKPCSSSGTCCSTRFLTAATRRSSFLSSSLAIGQWWLTLEPPPSLGPREGRPDPHRPAVVSWLPSSAHPCTSPERVTDPQTGDFRLIQRTWITDRPHPLGPRVSSQTKRVEHLVAATRRAARHRRTARTGHTA